MGTAEPVFLLDRKGPFRIALAVWLAVGIGTWFAADSIGRPAQVVLAGLWLVGLGLLLRQFIVSLFGPVLAYDVLRVGRKSRQIWFRVAYALFLAILFTWIYLAWMSFSEDVGSRAPRQKMARMAETYFYTYMIVQFIMVCFLTPAAVAGAIADEKERRTLEFLLATDLRDREILFGKLATRVGSLVLFLLAGLPILGMLQFFGGIDPDLVIAGFAATFMVVLSLAAVGIAASVLSRKARDAIALTYLVGVAYIVLSFVIYGVSVMPALRFDFELLGYTIASEDLGYPFVCGNPLFMVGYVMLRRGFGGGVDVFNALSHFTLFHAIVIALLLAWAGINLRPIALRQTFGSQSRSFLRRLVSRRQPKERKSTAGPRRVSQRVFRPAVGDSPILWKEVFVDAGLKLGVFAQVVVALLVAMSFVPIAFVFWFSVVEPGSRRDYGEWWSAMRWDQFGQGMNIYLRSAGTVVACLVFLAIAIRGSGTVSGERDRHTLDALLTTPLSARTIVWGKWWGCLLGMRWAWAWLFGLWLMVLASRGVHPVMFVGAIISVAVYASGYAWIGVYCSLHMRTTLRSTMAAILLSVFISGGYFLIFLFCCIMPMNFSGGMRGESDPIEVFVDFLCSFSPPVNMAWLPIREFDRDEMSLARRDIPYPPFWILGLIAWGAMSYVLSRMCVTKFRQLANRGGASAEPFVRLRSSPPPLPPRKPKPA
jgi:ABC-type transport system involved in multi-copper enzyme maturation permease subunit